MPHKLIIVLAIILPLIGCRDDKPIPNNSDESQETPAVHETWEGTESAFEERFVTHVKDGENLLYDTNLGELVSMKIILLNNSGGRWIEHNYKEGFEEGHRIVWDDDGKKVMYKYYYRKGKLEKTLIRAGKSLN
jgi:hypothetical protein